MTCPDSSVLSFTTLADADPHDYLAYSGPGTADVTDRFDRYLAAGNYRREWLHVARRAGDVVARAALWGPPGSPAPVAVDHFDFRPGQPDGTSVGAQLLRAVYGERRRADAAPDLHMFLPARWRETDEAPAIRARITAAEQAGLQVLVERHRFECLADTSLPDDVPPLSFRSAPVDDTVLVDLLGRIGHGSLDAGTVRSVSQLGASGAAQVYLKDMDALPGDRRSWLLASDDEAQIVGVAIASTETSPYPLVAFVGVDPRHRGQDYGRALLVETTRRVLAAGAERVRADTDMSNAPMVSVFSRAGWQPWATRLVMQVAPT